MGKRVLRTKLCDMLGIEYPILSAGMGPTLIGESAGAPVELVVAVSEAGGLGVSRGQPALRSMNSGKLSVKSKHKPTNPYGVDLLLPKHLDLKAAGSAGIDADELPLSMVLEKSPSPIRNG